LRHAPLRPLLIFGPTASGKSALALEVARRDGGCVINADALQVYDCWRVLTARPDEADLRHAPHRLYGYVSARIRYSVGDWLRDAAAALEACARDGLRPIFVGGTGLYFDALTQGLATIPPIPQELRERSEEILRSRGVAALLDDLAAADPATLARIDRSNPRRVQRAWEVLAATGRGLAAHQAAPTPPLMPADRCERLVIMPEKSLTNNMIEARFRKMIETGALDEAARFRAEGLPADLPSARALGAAELVAHLDGALSLDAAVAAAVAATARYAKRQRTWARNRMGDWPRAATLDDARARLAPQSAR
jgi:tRNA dimethylallyltransferase